AATGPRPRPGTWGSGGCRTSCTTPPGARTPGTPGHARPVPRCGKPSGRPARGAARASGPHRTAAGTRRDSSGSPRPLRAEVGSWLRRARGGDPEPVERAAGRLQRRRGDVEIAGGGAKVTVPQQDLDGPQVGAGLEQVGGEAVPQGVHMDALAQARGLQGALADHLDGAQGDRTVGPTPREEEGPGP